MILADTSIWVDHFRNENTLMALYLTARQIVIHPFVVGELALGNPRQNAMMDLSLRKMPKASVASPDDVLTLIKANGLAGKGIGYVDVHLLASALLTGDTWIWTADKKLHEAAKRMNLDAVFED